jgi:hypothetical protein
LMAVSCGDVIEVLNSFSEFLVVHV